MKKVLGVHGVGLKTNMTYGNEWSLAMGPQYRVLITEGRWDSTGNIARDIRLTLTDKDWRETQIELVVDALRDAYEHEDVTAVVAHSMGTVFAAEALRRFSAKMPIVFIGSPLNHPIWKNAFRTVGLGRPTPVTPFNFWNPDDLVSSARILGTRPPPWCDNTRIAVAGSLGRVVEHDAALYLANRAVASTLSMLA